MEQKKILFLGLENSGKTSFIRALDEDYNHIQNLAPTIKIDRSNLIFFNVSISRWDCGGQENFRKDYLIENSNTLSEADYILYFIDIIAEDRYEESLNYLIDILEAYKLIGNTPPFLICIHKADPSFINISTSKKKMLPKWEIKEKVSKLKNRLTNIIKDISINLTSIYDRNSILIAFSRVLKTFIPKIELVDIINEILEEFVNKNEILASSFIERKTLFFADFFKDLDNKELFTAILMNGMIFYENIQLAKPIFKTIIMIENYKILMTSFIKQDHRYFFIIFGRAERDLNDVLNIFEEQYIDRIYTIVE